MVSVLTLAALGFAACGDGDDESDTTAAQTTTEEGTTGASGAGGPGGTVEVSADPSGQLAFKQKALVAPAGPVTFSFTNEASTPHNFVIEDPDGNEVGATEEITGDSTTLDVDLEGNQGQYTFYCSVDAHREAGMEGPLAVLDRNAPPAEPIP